MAFKPCLTQSSDGIELHELTTNNALMEDMLVFCLPPIKDVNVNTDIRNIRYQYPFKHQYGYPYPYLNLIW
jgi:hypothetical protein